MHDYSYSYSYYSSGIAASDGSCTGIRGYDDIGEGTEVVVKNGNGTVLTTTSLGPGSGNATECTFDFSFEILEGEDDYAVSLGGAAGRAALFVHDAAQHRCASDAR